ncbi:MAG TPA: GNAT family N-acetyltransferase [Candidatus Limnocylindrales bacterium]|jgi:lipid II:glycine glycyltransferase (peptidoglycan interpeptide bridge formation enzyme)
MTVPTRLASTPPPDWDARTVDRPGGHVYQSVAWATHRSRAGWEPWFLESDAAPVLALTRPWPSLPGGSAYIPRGPAPPGRGDVAGLALEAATGMLAHAGIDVIAADAEVPAGDQTYRATLARLGFRPIEEIQPSRHRVTLPLDPPAGEDPVFAGIAKSTRQRIHQAEAAGVEIVRHDRAVAQDPGDGFIAPADEPAIALGRFYDLLLGTGRERGFRFGPREAFVPWWQDALAAGHLVLLEALVDGRAVAGLIVYRHGDRLSTVHSADDAATRDEHRGAGHLLRWRAIQVAIRENRTEMDLGGVDVPGARREPREGDPTWGLYRHKLSFGGRWLELTGARQRVIRPWRYAAGRVLARLARR